MLSQVVVSIVFAFFASKYCCVGLLLGFLMKLSQVVLSVFARVSSLNPVEVFERLLGRVDRVDVLQLLHLLDAPVSVDARLYFDHLAGEFLERAVMVSKPKPLFEEVFVEGFESVCTLCQL